MVNLMSSDLTAQILDLVKQILCSSKPSLRFVCALSLKIPTAGNVLANKVYRLLVGSLFIFIGNNKI